MNAKIGHPVEINLLIPHLYHILYLGCGAFRYTYVYIMHQNQSIVWYEHIIPGIYAYMVS